MRHRPKVSWRGGWPRGINGRPGAPQRLRLRHYQYRSPPQIERRVRARLERSEGEAFKHEKAASWSATGRREDLLFGTPAPGDPLWKSRVLRSDALHFDAHDGDYVIDWDALPAVQQGRPTPTS